MTPIVAGLRDPDLSSPNHELFSLETLERYKLIVRIAQGGMAEVFFAAREMEPFVHHPVVIKRLYQHLAGDAVVVQMFLDEARLLRELEHPHIVKTLEAGVIDGQCCIAMEYLEGQPLQVVLRRMHDAGGLPVALGVYVVACMLDGLSYAHDAKDGEGRPLDIVHRDISPHNVFVTNEGEVKLLDFGIAKAATQEGRTATGVVKGKIGYIAPEQVSGHALDRRADIWAVGVVLWETLTGQRLFKSDTEAASIHLTLKGVIPAMSTVRPEIPAALDFIVARALERDPSRRYQNARDMQHDLEAWFTKNATGPGPHQLGRIMKQAFVAEIVEQRRLTSVLIARTDCTPPSLRSVTTSSSDRPSRPPSVPPSLLPEIPRDRSTLPTIRPPGPPLAASAPTPRRAVRVAAVFAALSAVVTLLGMLLVGARSAPPKGTAAATLAAPVVPTELPASVEPAVAQPAAPAPGPIATTTLPAPAVAAVVAATGFHHAARAPAVTAKATEDGAPPLVASAQKAVKAVSDDDVGFLTIDTTPWSFVTESGKSLGQTPLVHVKLAPGPHVLHLRNPEIGVETTYTVSIETGKTAARRIGIE